MKTHCLILGLVVGFTLLLAGCAVGPDYVKPEAPQPQKWLEQEDPLIKSDSADFGQWWTVLNDPDLDTLVERLDVAFRSVSIPRPTMGISTLPW